MSEDKVEKLTEIVKSLSEIVEEQYIPSPFENKEAEREAASLIRELRQIIERLRRVVGESETDDMPCSLTETNKLKRDELAFIVWQFFQWIQYNSDCPAEYCNDFPCEYRQEQRKMCEENLADGSLDEEGMKDQQRNGYYHQYCDGDQQGCWVKYYLWCYRNGYDPQTGKKNDKTP